jgi:hypothetical protein
LCAASGGFSPVGPPNRWKTSITDFTQVISRIALPRLSEELRGVK